jgi:PAS domain-containing protein
MSLAYAATELTHVGTSRQLTLTTGLLLALVFAAMAGIAAWSWLNRRRLLARRRTAETELRATQNRLAQLSNQLPLALFSFRPGSGFEAVSDGIEYLLPVTAQQLLADPMQLLAAVAAEDRAGLQWLNIGEECPTRLEWLGRCLAPRAGATAAEDRANARWLQMHGSVDIGPGGERR